MIKDIRQRGRILQRRNARLKRKNPLCVHCLQQGRVREVSQWDHIIPLSDGGRDHESNLQGLCDECHEIKSLAERGLKAKPAQVLGLDWN